MHYDQEIWPPRHIPVIGGVVGVGLLDFRDGDLAILRLPTLGGLLDLPGLALGGGVLDLNVYVGHGRSRRCLVIANIGKRYHWTRSRPEFEWRAQLPDRVQEIIPEYLVAHGVCASEGGVWDLNLEE